MTMNSVCVFCGSTKGNDADYADIAAEMGRTLARRGLTLIYGGGSVGLMGILADAHLAARGKACGVIPRFLLEREVAHNGLSSLIIVDDMHDRKATMSEMADGFIAMPGGLGTLEEIFEIWTWRQLELHQKPFGFLNVNGFFDPLFTMMENISEKGFVRAEHRLLPLTDTSPDHLLSSMIAQRMEDY